MPKKILEKDIVDKIIQNWNDYFPDVIFTRKEYSIRNSRVDILAYMPTTAEELGIEDDGLLTTINIFMEVKYKSTMRDLIFEMKKHLDFKKDFYENWKGILMLCVISDDYDDTMIDFFIENDIVMYKLEIENDNIDTLTIKEFSPKNELIIEEQYT